MAAQLPAQITPELLQKGMQALQSGAVDPQTALAQYKKHFSPYSVKTEGPANQAGQGPAPAPAMGPENAQANQAQVMAQAPAPGSQPAGAVVPAPQNPLTFPMPDLKQLTPEMPHSGLGQTESEKATANHEVKDVKGQVLGDDPYNMAAGRIEDNHAYKNLMGGQDKIQGMLDMEANRQSPTNLRGLAAMVDSWKGGSLLAGMPAAQTPQDKAKLLLDYSQKLQQDKKGIFDAFSNSIKAQKSGQLTDLLNQTLVRNAQQSAVDPFTKVRQVPEATKVMNLQRTADKDLGPLQTAHFAAQQAMDHLSRASSIEDIQALDQFVKANIGKAATNYDLQSQGQGDASWSQRIQQAIAKAENGKLTDTNRSELAQALQGMDQGIQREHAARSAQLNSLGGAMDMEPGHASQVLSGYGRGPVMPTGAASQAISNTSRIRVQKPDGTIGNIRALKPGEKLPDGWKKLQ